MKAKTIGVAAVLVVVVAGTVGVAYQLYLQNVVEERLSDAVSELPPTVNLEYGDVEVGFLGREVRVSDVALSVEGDAPTVIEQVVVLDYDRHHEPPHRLHVRAEGIAQDVSEMPSDRGELLSRLGYTTLRGSYEMAYVYHPEQRELELRQLRGDVEELAGLGVYLRLADFDMEQVTSPEQMVPTFKIAEFEVSYQDASLMHRLLDGIAEEQGVGREELVAQLMLNIDAEAEQGGDFLQEIRGQIQAFLQDPQTLTVTGRPENAVAVTEVIALAMMRPERLPEVLNVQVEAK